MYYFASDTHLGLRVGRTADDRERLFVRWLDDVSADAADSRACWANCRD